ncbi:MAG: hypothetical protein ABI867_24275 [Kofleriaceae bacterium]
MNVDVRVLFTDGERAARRGELTTARACYLEAGQCAADVQLWRAAIRCYRHALELDLLDREVVDRIARMPPRVISGRGWDEYRNVLDQHPEWLHFTCRSAHIVMGDLGAVVECPSVGPVLELLMTEKDLVETRPDARFHSMPIAMAMIVLRRALWTNPRERPTELMTVRVTFAGQQRVRLDEHGDWEPIIGEPSR